MSKTMLNIKIDSNLKKEAQEVVGNFGLSLSVVLSNYLKELVQEKRVVFSDHPEPNKKTQEILKKSLKEIENKKTKKFLSNNELDDYLMNV